MRKYYNTGEGELQLVKVEAKTGEHEGVYYRLTVKAPNKKLISFKVEMPKPQESL